MAPQYNQRFFDAAGGIVAAVVDVARVVAGSFQVGDDSPVFTAARQQAMLTRHTVDKPGSGTQGVTDCEWHWYSAAGLRAGGPSEVAAQAGQTSREDLAHGDLGLAQPRRDLGARQAEQARPRHHVALLRGQGVERRLDGLHLLARARAGTGRQGHGQRR
jgi:hypothetical protein